MTWKHESLSISLVNCLRWESLLGITISVSHGSGTITTSIDRVLLLGRLLLSVVTDGSIERHARILVCREVSRTRIFVIGREVTWSGTLMSLLLNIGTTREDRLVH